MSSPCSIRGGPKFGQGPVFLTVKAAVGRFGNGVLPEAKCAACRGDDEGTGQTQSNEQVQFGMLPLKP